jgi:hypothetical protein
VVPDTSIKSNQAYGELRGKLQIRHAVSITHAAVRETQHNLGDASSNQEYLRRMQVRFKSLALPRLEPYLGLHPAAKFGGANYDRISGLR